MTGNCRCSGGGSVVGGGGSIDDEKRGGDDFGVVCEEVYTDEKDEEFVALEAVFIEDDDTFETDGSRCPGR